MSFGSDFDIEALPPGKKGFIQGAGDFLAGELKILGEIGMEGMNPTMRETISRVEVVLTADDKSIAWTEAGQSRLSVSAPRLFLLFELIHRLLPGVELSPDTGAQPTPPPPQHRRLGEATCWTAPDLLAAQGRYDVIETFKVAELFVLYHEVCHLVRGHDGADRDRLAEVLEPQRHSVAADRLLTSRELVRKFFELDADNQAAAFTMQRLSAGPISYDAEGRLLQRSLAESMRLVHAGLCALFIVEDMRLSSGRSPETLYTVEESKSTIYPHPFVRWLNVTVFASLAQRKWVERWKLGLDGNALVGSTQPPLDELGAMAARLGLPEQRWQLSPQQREVIARDGLWHIALYDKLLSLFTDHLQPWNQTAGI